MDTTQLENIVRKILTEKLTDTTPDNALSNQHEGNEYALFSDVTQAINAAQVAFKRYHRSPLKTRSAIISAIRKEVAPLIPKLSADAVTETGMGNAQDKIAKNKAALENTPGVEDLTTKALTGDDGMALFEYSPFGVVGSITPSTNSTETIINNAISMLAAGDSVYFSPHPGAKAISLWLIQKMEQIAFNASGIRNLIVTVKNPSIKATQEMMANSNIALLVVTGGPAIVETAMKTGKKVIGAGAGNPPCLVDETAEIPSAAQSIVAGASFDYNVPCIAEKSVVVVDQVANRLIEQMQSFGAYLITKPEAIKSLHDTCFTDNHVTKNLIGKSPNTILKAAGIACPENEPKLIILETQGNDPFVINEQLMPVLPIVRVNDFEQGLQLSLTIENSLHHTAVMHSQNVSRLNKTAQLMQTSIFVKNGPSYSGIGVNGEGFTTFTIATPTGEGTTSAKTFARSRRCVLLNGFSVR